MENSRVVHADATQSRTAPETPREGLAVVPGERPSSLSLVTHRAPSGDGLAEPSWWRLFIDIHHHPEASALPDPASFYDRGLSPGYKASMSGAFRSELLDDSPHLRKDVDLAEYERLHDLVSEHLENRHDVRKWASGDGGHGLEPVSYRIQGRETPAADINDVRVCGLDLMCAASASVDERRQAITCFADGRVHVNYRTIGFPDAAGRPAGEGGPQAYVVEVLARYQREKRNAAPEARLLAIARVIRTLHVMHAFRDANGRLHVMLMLNKFLKQEGFSHVVLQRGPEVFGGSYSLPELVAEMRTGMQAFADLVAAQDGAA